MCPICMYPGDACTERSLVNDDIMLVRLRELQNTPLLHICSTRLGG